MSDIDHVNLKEAFAATALHDVYRIGSGHYYGNRASVVILFGVPGPTAAGNPVIEHNPATLEREIDSVVILS